MARTDLVVVVILVLVLGASIAYFEYVNLGSSTDNNSTNGSNSMMTIGSAQLLPKDQFDRLLSVSLKNNYKTSTSTIQLLSECSPDFSLCQTIGSQPSTFVLPTLGSYTENITFSTLSSVFGIPVHGQSYYFILEVAFGDGTRQDLHVVSVAGDFPIQPTYYSSIFDITDVVSANVQIFSGNLSGRMTIKLDLNPQFTSPVNANLRGGKSSEIGIIWNTLVSTPSGNSLSPNTITMSASFSTVNTGIASGKYYMVLITTQYYDNSYFWIRAST